MQKLLRTKNIAVKALFISVFIHLIITALFDLKFRVYPASKKPGISFLGSFLNKNDLNPAITRSEYQTKDIQISSNELFVSNTDSRSDLNTDTSKPSFSSYASNEKKRFLKIIEPIEVISSGYKDSMDIGIKQTVPKTPPLTLDTP